MLALGCAAAPKPVTECCLKDCDRLVGGASRTSASKLARHGNERREYIGGHCRSEQARSYR
ncbi:hypothetical protein C1886_11155 [Pseudomonas sp. FW300-N1A1]|nr:hypothetical protein C1886_11155 [Pseudomonas sp. FW300-N1A1]